MTKEEIKELAEMLVRANEDCYYCGLSKCIKTDKWECTQEDWERYLDRRFNGNRRKVLPHSSDLY